MTPSIYPSDFFSIYQKCGITHCIFFSRAISSIPFVHFIVTKLVVTWLRDNAFKA